MAELVVNPVGWFEIYVNKLDRAKAFYEAVFLHELTPLGVPTEDFKMLAFPSDMTRYGCAGALVYMKAKFAGHNSVLVYFSCADCAIEEARVVPAGGQIMRPKMSIGEYGFISLIVDTEGNVIGLHSLA